MIARKHLEANNIDNLATDGVIFTNYYSSPLCAPSRAMLLSGNDNHVAGIGIQAFSLQDYGYEGILSDRVAIIPEILKNNGYKKRNSSNSIIICCYCTLFFIFYS